MRVLLLADTHLGFDFPLRPRVRFRRRGPDFFRNTELALAPAMAGDVDLVVHGGDLLFRSQVPARLVDIALEPLLRVADRGVAVILVPGNHERGAIPFPLLAAHENLHILDRPKTVVIDVGDTRVAVAGFPCLRNGIRDQFSKLVRETGGRSVAADVKLLCFHQTVEGATVGPAGYVFRGGPDVIRGRDLPGGFAAVLSGHIHRAQVLTRDLWGRPFAAPVFYPGSVERTSFAERDESKGFMTLDLLPDHAGPGRVAGHGFHELPTRPLVDIEIDVRGLGEDHVRAVIQKRLREEAPDSVVRVALRGADAPGRQGRITAQGLRDLAPETMTVSLKRQRGTLA